MATATNYRPYPYVGQCINNSIQLLNSFGTKQYRIVIISQKINRECTTPTKIHTLVNIRKNVFITIEIHVNFPVCFNHSRN